MYRVAAVDLETYFDSDPVRKPELLQLDRLIRATAPALTRYFHQGTPAGEAGMRLKMIGYGRFEYAARSGQSIEWPIIGVALQKNYISAYFSVTRTGSPIVAEYAGRLSAARTARNNFSFVAFGDLDAEALSSLIAETARIVEVDPDNPRRYKEWPSR